MIVWLRHGNDDVQSTYEHDPRLKYDRALWRRLEFLLAKHGVPEVILCSPFRRARSTMHAILKLLPDYRVEYAVVPELSRYFTSSEARRPGVAPSTMKWKPPIHETKPMFHARCRAFCKYLRKEWCGRQVWVVTHTLVLKRAAKAFRKRLPKHLEFCESFTTQV